MVQGTGPRDAKIVIVGEAPGRDEELKGEPFVGPSGHLLNDMLATVGINRRECYLTNVIKERPINNDFGVYYVDKQRRNPTETLTGAWANLRRELEAINPNVVVVMGNEALRALTGKRGIDSFRGSILKSGPFKVVPAFHPAYILRVYGDRPLVELDLRRAREESVCREYRELNHSFIIEPGFETAVERVRRCKEARRIAFDIETSGELIRCLGLAWSSREAISIPFLVKPRETKPSEGMILVQAPVSHSLNSRWTLEEETVILRLLVELFASPSIEFVAQNASFDTTVLEREFGIIVNNLYMDTMHASHCVYPEFPKALDFLASIYTKVPYYSDYDPAVDQETWIYNCYDSAVTYEVSERLDEELKDHGLSSFYFDQIRPTSPALTRLQNRGVKINLEERGRQHVALKIQLARHAEVIREMTGDQLFNPSSPKQVATLLYDKLKLPKQFHHKTKAVTTDKNAMEALERKHPAFGNLFKALRKHSSLDQVISGFFKKELPNGRVYTSYNLSGTVTGRVASSESFVFNPQGSTNLQNIRRFPELDRKCFVSEEGYSFIKADLSQAEFRIVVWYAKIRWMIDKLLTDPKFSVHRWLASLIYKKPESEVTKGEYDIAKNGVYGGNYDMGVQTAARTYHLTYPEAKHVLETHRRAIPEIPTWWTEVQRELAESRTLRNPLGRKRIFFGRYDHEMFRAAYSWKAQSLVADIINHGIVQVDTFDRRECYPNLQVHDEIVCQCRDELIDTYVPKIRSSMEIPIMFDGVSEPLVIPVEVKVGKNWLDCKEVKI